MLPARTTGTLQHCLHLSSVYTHFLPQHGRPEVTTMPLGLGATVDYIFFSAESCENGNRTGERSVSWVGRAKVALPWVVWGLNSKAVELPSSLGHCARFPCFPRPTWLLQQDREGIG